LALRRQLFPSHITLKYTMSLLHDVLRTTANVAQISAKPKDVNILDNPPTQRAATPSSEDGRSDDDELINVMSVPGTPRRVPSRPMSRSTSPTRSGAPSRKAQSTLHPLHITPSTPRSKTDPLRVLTTDLIQRIFSMLSTEDLATSSRVSLKWNKSQSLNYLWFRHYRKEEFGDKSLPTGKWTRKESKEDWRKTFFKMHRENAERDGQTSRYGYATPDYPGSGYATPKEIREARWAQENAADASGIGLGKVEMREMYKGLGGRMAKSKNRGVGRDKGGWEDGVGGFD